jgi:hypothetical protein
MWSENHRAGQPQQDFYESLPAWPFSSHDLGKEGCHQRERALAVQLPYLQLNPANLAGWLVFDIDRRGAATAWKVSGLPEPTWVAENPANGHAHIAYRLAVPVCTSSRGVKKIKRYLIAIHEAYTQVLHADPLYVGLLCKNPLSAAWVVAWSGNKYTLKELAAAVTLAPSSPVTRTKKMQGEGRNVDLFNALRAWAARWVRTYRAIATLEQWGRAVERQAHSLNPAGDPLPLAEVRATARSVARWTWAPPNSQEFRERQAARGRQKGARKRDELAAEAAQLRAAGQSQRKIAQRLGVAQNTIRNWLK